MAERKYPELFGDNLHFDATEAFNLLRTNLQFSFSDGKNCHIISIVSAIPASGKSIIACNLGYAFAKDGKKTLIIDCDLRLPTISKKLDIPKYLGLSNCLTSNVGFEEAVVHYTDNLDVLPAGDIPPKPSELLGSAKFEGLLNCLKEQYDFIILDSTPIQIVSDSLVMASKIDGMVLVVRKENVSKQILNDTIRQINLAKGKILGIVFNDSKADHDRTVEDNKVQKAKTSTTK